MSPVQAPLVGAGPEQASMRMAAAGMSLGQAPMGGAGLVQAHGAEGRQGGPEWWSAWRWPCAGLDQWGAVATIA